MRRFRVEEEEEEDDDRVEIAPPSSSSLALTTSTTTTTKPASAAAKAHELHLDVKSFERAARAAASAVSASTTTLAKPPPRRAPIADVGLARDHGVWAPQPQEEQLVTTPAPRLVEVAAAAPPPSSTEVLLPVSSSSLSVTRHGSRVADYQGRGFADSRRWPQRLDFGWSSNRVDDYDDDGDDYDDDAANELDAEVRAYLGTTSKRSRHQQHDHKSTSSSSRLPQATAPPATREYIGHTMSIAKLRVSGCLALTAGMDGRCIVWDTALPGGDETTSGLANEAGALQTYFGHDGNPVRDCAFPGSSSAARFASAGMDGYANLWDTETGQLVSRFAAASSGDRGGGGRGSVNAVAFKPDDDFHLLCAFSDRKLRHYDTRAASSGEQQVYDFHQGAVNTAMFCDSGRKFVSTADDRKMAVWDWGVPTPSKIVAEVALPSMPAVAVHPSSLKYVGVGLDNALYEFKISATTGVVKRAGQASPGEFRVTGTCEPCYSPCGKFLACGDGSGDVAIFSSTRLFRQGGGGGGGGAVHRIASAHVKNTLVSSVQFHPCFEGVLLSAGWDGKLKWWQ